ncbi:alpha/beta fold hydrolase [Microlunatus ginsengisoli]|uniref:Alpha/beta fold hydrolase n=1 Tax=Microlunatus ginsengisoli TaxID=363863 RepID=A0ABP7AG77_9ACTN
MSRLRANRLRANRLRPLLATLGAIACLLAGPVAPAVADTPVTETATRVATVPEPDGAPVSLDVSLFTTDPAQPRPAIVLAHGFGGSKNDSRGPAETLARDGYTVITYTARGFGRSGGRIHLDDPAYEGADTTTLVDFAAGRAEVEKTGPDDPVIGFAGASYGGAATFLAAALDKRVDAIVPAFTYHSLTQSLFPQYATSSGTPTSLAGFTPIDEAGVFKQRWSALLFGGGGGSAGQVCGRFDRSLCAGYLATAQSGRPSPALLSLLGRSDLGPQLSRITAPTLIIAGLQDTLFPLDQADANLLGLPAGTTASMSWVNGGHDAAISFDDLMPQLQAWFASYLKHQPVPSGAAGSQVVASPFSLVIPQTSLVGDVGDRRNRRAWTAPVYPGRAGAAVPTRTVPIAGRAQQIVSPPGGTPASLTSLPGTGSVLATASSIAGYALGVLPNQSATFTGEPLTEPLSLVGSGRVRLSVTSSAASATLFVSVWDLGPDLAAGPSASSSTAGDSGGPGSGGPGADGSGSGGAGDGTRQGSAARATPGSAVLPGLAVSPVQLSGLTPGTPTQVEVALPAVSHQVPVGHRLQLVVSSTDQAYAVPSRAATYRIGLAGPAELTLPVVDAAQVGAGTLDVPLPLVIVVGALMLAAGTAALVFWLRQRAARPREDLRDVPLVVQDLVKTYGLRRFGRRGRGLKAVNGVSFEARPGQVVGLLGPNGAGKTTVLRMLVGLIRPDSGSVYVGGEPVHAGADVLGSVGAFIEGPGFLPHLSGMENLRAYWAATGRPIEEAGLEQALAIAGLDHAIDRKVRGYSQGMRQRLGIAQAMLGRPELLLLDEPTNGLDPPQIKAMRTVLHDYAATGRTVVVSSHLLAEVQQTCTHVVVMHKGKVILTGSMAELTATDDVTVLGLSSEADRGRALELLAGMGMETTVDVGLGDRDGLIRCHGPVPRPDLVAALVGAGIGVDFVDGHRQLEEVFMTLVGPDGITEPGADADD